MNRRDFLRRSAVVAGGLIGADQLEILERIGWRRTLFPGVSFGPRFYDGDMWIADNMIHVYMNGATFRILTT